MVDITIGQYYPEDSVIHKLDPRVKLFGTLVFVVMVFMINNVIGYGLITLFLGIVIKMSKVPFKKMMKGIRGIIFIMLLSVVFNIFLTPGDLMLFYRLENNFSIRDVVIFEKDGVSYTGRIIAKDGDTVEITNEAEVKVNGSLLAENDIYYSTPMYDNNVSYPVTLRENQYFILCDYREGAKDSRYFGAVEMEEIKGKVITIIRKNEL